MPVDWKADTPLKAFIEQNHTQQRGFSGTNRAKKHNHRVFNNRISRAVPTTRPNAGSKRALYEIEGILEVQRTLLQKLATQENILKGLSGCESHSSNVN